MVVLELPYPPTVNHYWKHTRNGKHYITAKGKTFQQEVRWLTRNRPKFIGKVLLEVDIYPPDNRKRDIDNIFKALLDALTNAGVIIDDSFVYKLVAEKLPSIKGGKVIVRIKEFI
ncbi:endodeoxyribonuclease RusA [Actinobacillus minor NM305]|uniref:Crossover junction endodeoxyribonuclease rusA n=1 Tax=Actinobacillus minor NM305 TaxID=637911 RepID=C5S0Z1_9PAST|nr:RusA family crossover junction endodeoxyribonuclease [Actinobacillus minor]EER47574.1 endodeoxyribonuclease RusA [Actinobacillus minor NM305]MDY5105602.1 RusA family crossover junction endodeoxyribonuclease [Actinobacillus minor]